MFCIVYVGVCEIMWFGSVWFGGFGSGMLFHVLVFTYVISIVSLFIYY